MTDPETRAQIEDHLAEILDGDADPELYERLADDDTLRDLRHQAEAAVALVRAAGADHVCPSDLEARLLAALPVPVVNDPAPEAPAPEAPAPEAPAPEAPAAEAPAPEPPAPEPLAPEPPAPSPAPAPPRAPILDFVSRHKLLLLGGGGGVAVAGAAAAAAALFLTLRVLPGIPGVTGPAWSGTVAHVARAGDRGALELCDHAGDHCRAAKAGDPFPVGATLKTGATVRAELALTDGTSLSLDRDTELTFDPRTARRLRIAHGAVAADVKSLTGNAARLDLPVGHLTVLGTKFSLVTHPGAATVGVSRGTVELTDESARTVRVRAGEEGRIATGEEPTASATQLLGELFAWADETLEHPESGAPARGLGELRAKKPSDKSERDAAVTLASHAVKVRISGAVARTEIDEVFRNETGDVLEGIYRFPLPPDATIERLALEVDGHLEEGAFVDRDRAAAIWRGGIVNAAPELRPTMRDEIVWVPGPWRDPALLEWQRGSRFELRIFPIPARGSRRVVLAYTQVLAPAGSRRRYTYPLAHDPSGSTRVGDFRFDAQVRGHDAALGVSSLGYAMAAATNADVTTVTRSEQDFVPAGDLVLEYALPGRERELSAWAYAPSPDAVRNPASAGPADAGYPYVALALRPVLPRVADREARTYALVVDSSRSMFGESYQRASGLAARLVRELDDADRFTVLACDTTCRELPGGLQSPGQPASERVRSWLAGMQPEGASDPTAAIGAARRAAGTGRGLRVVYLGDGTPTAGPLRPATMTAAVQGALPPEVGTVTAVGIGAESDLESLRALARAGGGVVLPYVPGQSTAEAAFATLAATLGHTLRDVELVLPAGLIGQAPERLDAIPAGRETIVVARMTRSEVTGDVVLRGTLGRERFERRYPLRVTATNHPGNAFVPRLYAATRITDLERRSDAEAKAEAIALSSRFDVASRYTSLLVLESAAMFQAFGLDNRRDAPEWSGEEDTQATTATSAEEALALLVGAAARAGVGRLGGVGFPAGRTRWGGGGGGWFGGARKSRAPSSPAPAAAAPEAAPVTRAERGPSAAAPPSREAADAWPGARDTSRRDEPLAEESVERPPPRPPEWESRRDWVPMRRIWERKGEIVTGTAVPRTASVAKIAEAERAVTEQPNKRGAVRGLYVLYALSGDLPRAADLVERWSEKEPLDAEALTARADLAAERGDRDLAIRILGSVVEVRPGDVAAQERLARLHRWGGQPALGCRHRIAVAELHQGNERLLAAAVECARETGEATLAELLLGMAAAPTRTAAERRLATPAAAPGLSGDLRLVATWSGAGHDLDLGLLTPEGHRASWLGAPTREVITAEDATSDRREALALRGAAPGEYVVEIVRARGHGPVSGSLELTVAGTRRTIPFTVTENRTAVAVARITQESRLIPVE